MSWVTGPWQEKSLSEAPDSRETAGGDREREEAEGAEDLGAEGAAQEEGCSTPLALVYSQIVQIY